MEPWPYEDVKGIVTLEISSKKFGTFEKEAPVRPHTLFYLPQVQGRSPNLSLSVSDREIAYARDDLLIENVVVVEYQLFIQ